MTVRHYAMRLIGRKEKVELSAKRKRSMLLSWRKSWRRVEEKVEEEVGKEQGGARWIRRREEEGG